MSKGRKFISIAEFNPDFILEWHPVLNLDLDPHNISYGSSKKVWWLGKCGHEWEQTPNDRSGGRGCPICAKVSRSVSHTKNWIHKYGSLADKNPLLAKQWHPIKNGHLTANDVSAGSGSKAWWICEKGHEWEAAINSRNQGVGCPICSGHKVLEGYNDLATTNPILAMQWHPVKNGELSPKNVTAGSSRKIWWICPFGHEWMTGINHRVAGTDCPVCAGKKIVAGANDLAKRNPQLALEWHPTKNGTLTATQVAPNSNKKVWWQCVRGHEWKASVCGRFRGRSCPICVGEMKTSFPEQAIFFYFNQITQAINRYSLDRRTEIDVYLPEYKIGIEYDGIYYHNSDKAFQRELKKEETLKKAGILLIRVKEADDNFARSESGEILYSKPGMSDVELNSVVLDLIKKVNHIANVSLKADVDITQDRLKIYEQYVSGEKQRSLLSQKPDLAKQWHPTKNGKLVPENVSVSANKRVWWMCKEGHEWQAMISSRSQGVGCPYCSGLKVLRGINDLATKKPEIAKQWHPTKNGTTLPNDVSEYSNKKYWWICDKGHEWEASVSDRRSKKGCAVCSGHKVLLGYNDLLTTHSELASEWHPTKNGSIKAIDVTHGSDKKSWWLGKCGHEWEATISSRSLGNNCPYCSNQKVLVGYNDIATTNKKLASQWHPSKNGNHQPTDYTSGSNKKAWWLGECGHEWEANIASRNSGRGCPYCSGKKLLAGFNDLLTINPKLALEWHPTKNKDLKPSDFMPGSNKKVWWICEKGHEWENSINVRNGGNNCPYCANQMVLIGYNDLATTNQKLASQWHPTKNGDKKPTDYTAGANKKAWWICDLGHEWEAYISSRSKGAGCQKCYRMRRKKPDS